LILRGDGTLALGCGIIGRGRRGGTVGRQCGDSEEGSGCGREEKYGFHGVLHQVRISAVFFKNICRVRPGAATMERIVG
jgi:hypothetical protein